MNMSENIADLSAALAKAQGAMEQPGKDREVTVALKKQDGSSGGSYKFKYATLDNIIATVRPHLSANDLAFVQFIDGGCMVTRLLHSSGQYLDCSIPFPQLPNKPQEAGSLITYFKRYSFCTALGIVADEDDDANVAQGNEYAAQARPGSRPNRQAAIDAMKPKDDYSPAAAALFVQTAIRGTKSKADLDDVWRQHKVERARINLADPKIHESLVADFAKQADTFKVSANPQHDDVLNDDVPY